MLTTTRLRHDGSHPSRRVLYRRGKRQLLRLLAGRWRGPRRTLEPAVRRFLAPRSWHQLASLLGNHRVALAMAATLLGAHASRAAPPVELSDITAGNGGFVLTGIEPGDRSGVSVAGAGDVNGDGLDDVIIGAWGADPGGPSLTGGFVGNSQAGESYVVFGRPGSAALDLHDLVAGIGGFLIEGAATDDLLGWSVSGAGDVNGDGLDDLIVGAVGADPGGASQSGVSYVVFGKADTFAVEVGNIVAGVGGFVINGIDEGDLSGWSVSGAGDVNGDGLADLVVGARTATVGGVVGAGQSYVVFGTAGTAAIDLADIVAGTGGFVINGIGQGDAAGWSVAGAGDVNGDGLADLVVGALGADPDGREGAGESYVVLGKSGTAAVDLLDISNGNGGGFVIKGGDLHGYAGWSVSGAGDVSGDGLDDVIVGARCADSAASAEAGKSYVVFGRTAITAIDLATFADGFGKGFVIRGIDTQDHSGESVSGAGDFNGDGLADLIVGAPSADPGGDGEAGESYVVFGKPDTTPVELADVVAGNGGFVINGIEPGDESGAAVAAAGDFNGDGLGDLLVGAPGADPDGIDGAGESYVIFGTAPSCPADCAGGGDGTVDITDLLRVLAEWSTGPTPGAECNVDDGGEGTLAGVVDAHDLVYVLAAWGACP